MPVFMFTDIEGSTRLWEEHPRAMGQVLARHDAILRKLIEEYGGSMIKYLGDGVFAVFEGGEPVRCALEIQKQLRKEDWGAIGTLHVRIALHAGDAEKRDGDFFGLVVNRTMRILATGWGGQVLLTPEVVKASGLPKQVTLQDLGVHWFKDLREPQQVLGLVHPDLGWWRFSPLRVRSSALVSSARLQVRSRPKRGKELKMTYQKLLQQTIGVTLITLFLVGCGALVATPTPLRPTATTVSPTLTPVSSSAITVLPTSTPTSTSTPMATATSTTTATATPTQTPTPSNTPTSAPTPTPAPTTGSVEGRLIGRDTHQPLAGALIVLCEITGDFKCTLHTNLTGTADAEGWFTVKEVPPGQYTVAYAKVDSSAVVSFEDGFAIIVPFRVLEGGLTDNEQGLSFEFREGHFLDFEVRVGETTEVEIAAWGL